jgi:hypothetical protein
MAWCTSPPLSLFSGFSGFWYFCPDYLLGTVENVQWIGTLVWLLPSTEHSMLIGTSLCPSLRAAEWLFVVKRSVTPCHMTPIAHLQQYRHCNSGTILSPVGGGRMFCVTTNTVSKIWSMVTIGLYKKNLEIPWRQCQIFQCWLIVLYSVCCIYT